MKFTGSDPVDHEMPRRSYAAHSLIDVLTTQSQMPTHDSSTQLRAATRTDTIGLRCNILYPSEDQGFIGLANRTPESAMRPDQNLVKIRLGLSGQDVVKTHLDCASAISAARSPRLRM